GTQNRQEAWLEVFYGLQLLKPSREIVAAVAPIVGYAAGNQALTFTSQQAYQLADAEGQAEQGLRHVGFLETEWNGQAGRRLSSRPSP
ncbi:hypothetical protein ACV34Z_35315, partial [Pseudomonas aeruginosa]